MRATEGKSPPNLQEIPFARRLGVLENDLPMAEVPNDTSKRQQHLLYARPEKDPFLGGEKIQERLYRQ